MGMTKDELTALPQSVFNKRPCGSDYRCHECGTVILKGESCYQSEVEGVKPFYSEIICPTCWAKHPADAVPVRLWHDEYWVSDSGSLLWHDGRVYSSNIRYPGQEPRRSYTLDHGATKLSDPEARAWAEKHGHAKAIFGEEPEEWPKFSDDTHCVRRFFGPNKADGSVIIPGGRGRLQVPDGNEWSGVSANECSEQDARKAVASNGHAWPSAWGSPTEEKPAEPEWKYGRDAADGMLFRWKDADGPYEFMTRLGVWRKGNTSGHAQKYCNGRFRDKGLITEPQAIAYAREWGSAWAEEMEPTPKPEPFLHPCDAAPSAPQPVGYSCRECGVLLGPVTADDDDTFRQCPACNRCWWDSAYPDEPAPFVQPGPQPGPWEKEWEWSGKFDVPELGEWFLRVLIDAVDLSVSGPTERRHNEWHPDKRYAGKRHILRPKPKPSEADCTSVATITADDIADAKASMRPAYEGDPADAAFSTKDSPYRCTKCNGAWSAEAGDRMFREKGWPMTCYCKARVIDRRDTAKDEQPTPSGKDRTMSKQFNLRITIPSVKTLAKYAVVWPVATTAKVVAWYIRLVGRTGTVITTVAGLAGLKLMGYPQPLVMAKECLAALTTALIG